VGIPGRVVRTKGEAVGDLEHGQLPDPGAVEIEQLTTRVEQLEERLRELLDQRDRTSA
jgi:serine O-acetyltransferase